MAKSQFEMKLRRILIAVVGSLCLVLAGGGLVRADPGGEPGKACDSQGKADEKNKHCNGGDAGGQNRGSDESESGKQSDPGRGDGGGDEAEDPERNLVPRGEVTQPEVEPGGEPGDPPPVPAVETPGVDLGSLPSVPSVETPEVGPPEDPLDATELLPLECVPPGDRCALPV